MNSNGLVIPVELNQAFEDIHANQLALQLKADMFSRAVHSEAQALAVASKAVWDEAKAVMKLQGDWKYENGMLYPLTLLDMAAPNV